MRTSATHPRTSINGEHGPLRSNESGTDKRGTADAIGSGAQGARSAVGEDMSKLERVARVELERRPDGEPSGHWLDEERTSSRAAMYTPGAPSRPGNVSNRALRTLGIRSEADYRAAGILSDHARERIRYRELHGPEVDTLDTAEGIGYLNRLARAAAATDRPEGSPPSEAEGQTIALDDPRLPIPPHCDGCHKAGEWVHEPRRRDTGRNARRTVADAERDRLGWLFEFRGSLIIQCPGCWGRYRGLPFALMDDDRWAECSECGTRFDVLTAGMSALSERIASMGGDPGDLVPYPLDLCERYPSVARLEKERRERLAALFG